MGCWRRLRVALMVPTAIIVMTLELLRQTSVSLMWFIQQTRDDSASRETSIIARTRRQRRATHKVHNGGTFVTQLEYNMFIHSCRKITMNDTL